MMATYTALFIEMTRSRQYTSVDKMFDLEEIKISEIQHAHVMSRE